MKYGIYRSKFTDNIEDRQHNFAQDEQSGELWLGGRGRAQLKKSFNN